MAHKHIRKISRIGSNSLGVILPMSWLKYYNLKNGDYLELISNGTIKIKPSKEKKRSG